MDELIHALKALFSKCGLQPLRVIENRPRPLVLQIAQFLLKGGEMDPDSVTSMRDSNTHGFTKGRKNRLSVARSAVIVIRERSS